MPKPLEFQFDPEYLLRKRRSLKRELLKQSGLKEKRIAVLGGSVTSEVINTLELFLLNAGIQPVFYESQYNRYYEDIIFENSQLDDFSPDVVFVHTTSVNIRRFPQFRDSVEEVDDLLREETGKFYILWDQIEQKYGCPIIQNNFELPQVNTLGNLGFSDPRGATHFTFSLNQYFAEAAQQRNCLYIHDIHTLSARYGLEQWHSRYYWYAFKFAMHINAIPVFAHSLASIIKAIYGQSKKCLVLDLDNTLWGGVIGDDGVNGIQLGLGTPTGEAFSGFQTYLKRLHSQGVLLAVCSKNELDNAEAGFSHPDSVLQLEDFAIFVANWKTKSENIYDIAETLNLGLDSLVFFDDDPTERALVASQLPEVSVPELGDSDVTDYITILEKSKYFEPAFLSEEDLKRSQQYADNAKRNKHENNHKDYDSFLRDLDMEAEIKSFSSLYLQRIAQLINKTNQFNLTAKRYTLAEVEDIADNEEYLTLYGRLTDKFGDNGLISVVVARVEGLSLHIDGWLMSCRVFQRGMEVAMFDELLALARACDVVTVYGYYYKTEKNSIVHDFYKTIGFECQSLEDNGDSVWYYAVPQNITPQNKIIKVV